MPTKELLTRRFHWRPSPFANLVCVFLCFWLLFLVTASDSAWHNDGLVRFYVTGNMLHYGDPVLREAESGYVASIWAVAGRGNRLYSFYGLGHSLALLPFHAAADWIDHHAGIPYVWDIHRFMLGMLAPLEAALLGAAVFGAVRALSYPLRTSFITAGVISLATIIWPHSRDLHDNLQEALLVTVSLSMILASQPYSKYKLIGAGAALGLAIVTRTSAVLALPGLLIALFGKHRTSPTHRGRLVTEYLAFFGGMAATGWLWFAYNFVRFGHPLDTGYGQMFERASPLPGQPILPAAAAWLVGLSSGILIYVPVLLLTLVAAPRFMKQHRLVLVGGVLTFILYLLFYSSFRNLGYWSYGPNYLLPVIAWPLLSLASLFEDWKRYSLAVRVLATVILVLSFLIQLPGVIVPSARTQLTIAPDTEEERWVSWRYAPLRVQTLDGIQFIHNVLTGREFDLYGSGTSTELVDTYYALNLPDWWWVFIVYRGFQPALIVPVVLLAGSGMAMKLVLLRSTSPIDTESNHGNWADAEYPSSDAENPEVEHVILQEDQSIGSL